MRALARVTGDTLLLGCVPSVSAGELEATGSDELVSCRYSTTTVGVVNRGLGSPVQLVEQWSEDTPRLS